MNYNIKDILLNKNISNNKPSINNFNFIVNISIDEYELSTAYLKTVVNNISLKLDETKRLLKAVSNNENLKIIKDVIDNGELVKIEITGYNYTNLRRAINIKNSMIKHYEYFDEIYRKLKEIVDSDDSEEIIMNRLNDVADFTNSLLKKYNEKFKLLDYGFPNNTEFPNYYNGDNISVTLSYESKNDYMKLYNELKLCSDQYSAMITGYQKDLIKYFSLIDKTLNKSFINNSSFLGIRDKYSPIKNNINRIVHIESKITLLMLRTILELLSYQINNINDLLKQDIMVLQKIVKYNKEKEL